MIDTFSFAHESAAGQIITITFVMLDIFQICMKRLPSSTFVLDGIDECSDNEELLRETRDFAASFGRHKFLFLSRRNVVQLGRTAPQGRQQKIERCLVSIDISRLSKSSVSRMNYLWMRSRVYYKHRLVSDFYLIEAAGNPYHIYYI
jgi:hypothetical protein